MTKAVKRKLTCVFCADVKAYSNLMERDEAGTLETLRRYREAMDGLVERHDGRVINTWGDAVFAEFSSVVEAVQCAVEIQRELAIRNMKRPEDERMWFRIGINLGDVMVEGDDLYGEGVNIAARLQEVAEPGGIAISGPVHDQVRNKLVIGFDYLGEQAVRNHTEPVPSYRVVLDRNAQPDEALDPQRSQPADKKNASGRSSDQPVVDHDPGGSRRHRGGHRHDGEQPGFFAENGRVAQWIGRFRVWYRGQSTRNQRLVGVVGILFVINVLTGLSTPWFLWPAAALGGVIYFTQHRQS